MNFNPGDKVMNKKTNERGIVRERLEAVLAVETADGMRSWGYDDVKKARKLLIVDVVAA